MLDVTQFRTDSGNIREMLRQRNASVEIVDEIINLDIRCRTSKYQLDLMCGRSNCLSVEVARRELARLDTRELRNRINERKTRILEKLGIVDALNKYRDSKLETLGNMLQGIDVEAGFSIDTLYADDAQSIF